MTNPCGATPVRGICTLSQGHIGACRPGTRKATHDEIRQRLEWGTFTQKVN